jgi:hypothetical protein
MQFGFRRGHSTVHPLIHFINHLTKANNQKLYSIAIFCDLQKAFDTVDHEILLKKLALLGINNIALKWFTSYLSERSQCVDINGSLSEEKCLLLSVIQGSILGPILFLCYINDLPNCTSLFTTLFADDGTCLGKNANLQLLINYANNELQKIANWFLANKMAVNTSKTKFIIFRSQGKQIEQNECAASLNLETNGFVGIALNSQLSASKLKRASVNTGGTNSVTEEPLWTLSEDD